MSSLAEQEHEQHEEELDDDDEDDEEEEDEGNQNVCLSFFGPFSSCFFLLECLPWVPLLHYPSIFSTSSSSKSSRCLLVLQKSTDLISQSRQVIRFFAVSGMPRVFAQKYIKIYIEAQHSLSLSSSFHFLRDFSSGNLFSLINLTILLLGIAWEFAFWFSHIVLSENEHTALERMRWQSWRDSFAEASPNDHLVIWMSDWKMNPRNLTRKYVCTPCVVDFTPNRWDQREDGSTYILWKLLFILNTENT